MLFSFAVLLILCGFAIMAFGLFLFLRVATDPLWAIWLGDRFAARCVSSVEP
jgi:hypothetical protein